MPEFDPLRVLVVDDDADTRANLRDILELDAHQVEEAGSVAEVQARTDWNGMDVVLMDRKLPDGHAEDLLPWLHQRAPEAALLIVTGYGDLEGAIAALRQGAADYILKPINPDALRASLTRVADRLCLARAKERSETAFRTLIEAAPCLIFLIRPDRSVAYLSRFAVEITGISSEAAVGRDYVATFLPAEFQADGVNLLHRVMAGEVVRDVSSPVRCADGSRRWVLWNALLLPDHEGSPALLAVGQDITGLKEAQERTLQAERLAAIGQMMTGLAHESGNALARSQACLEMLALEVQDRPEAIDLVSRVQKAQDDLQKLYEEVRNYAAPLKLQREPCRLDSVWRQAWNNLAVRRQDRDARLLEECAGVNLVCAGDVFRLEQVFRNVLENALAASRDPLEITIVAFDAWLDGRDALDLVIRDNGPGLGPEQRRRIFEPFFTTKTRGTGLGMAITKRIVEAHAGRITVGEECNRGAEIKITLPREGQS